MLKRLTWLVIGAVLGALAVTWGLKYHIVRADDGLHWVAKSQAEFADAYVDVRDFGLEQWQAHPNLAIALGRAGKGELLGASAQQSLRQAADRYWQEWTQ